MIRGREAGLARKIGSAVIVALFIAALFSFIQWRSAPPLPQRPIGAAER